MAEGYWSGREKDRGQFEDWRTLGEMYGGLGGQRTEFRVPKDTGQMGEHRGPIFTAARLGFLVHGRTPIVRRCRAGVPNLGEFPPMGNKRVAGEWWTSQTRSFISPGNKRHRIPPPPPETRSLKSIAEPSYHLPHRHHRCSTQGRGDR